MILLQSEPVEGDVCTKCWQNVSDFHNFYTHIESIHDAIHKSRDALDVPYAHYEHVKTELIEQSPKDENTLDDDDHWSFDSNPEDLTNDIIGTFQSVSAHSVLFTVLLMFLHYSQFKSLFLK